MREITNNGVTLSYPDEIGFAFNPCLLVASGDELVKMTIDIRAGEKKETIWMEAMKGRCYADVREYVQTFFDTLAFSDVDYNKERQTAMGKRVSFSVTATKSDEANTTVEYTFEVFYIWGALKVGGQEAYNSYRTLTWFRGFPFTVGVYAAGGGSIMFSKDGVADKFVNLPEQGVWNIPLKRTEDAKRYYLLSDCTGAFAEVTFDNTFDMTFRYSNVGTKTEKIRIDIIDDYDEGYYLRWINRHGFYCYYLFKPGDEARKVTSDGAFMRNNLLSYDMNYGYQGYTGRQQRMSREDTIPVCAPLVDSDTWDMLFDIATSPCVDLFVGYKNDEPKWMPVTIVSGSYTKAKAVLQDFICSIMMPDVTIQKL